MLSLDSKRSTLLSQFYIEKKPDEQLTFMVPLRFLSSCYILLQYGMNRLIAMLFKLYWYLFVPPNQGYAGGRHSAN